MRTLLIGCKGGYRIVVDLYPCDEVERAGDGLTVRRPDGSPRVMIDGLEVDVWRIVNIPWGTPDHGDPESV